MLLVVNVASQCGLTPQYAKLESLYERYQDRGFAVLGFPCNQFGSQEPGSESQIKTFCETHYGIRFPMFAKLRVNGPDAHPLYQFLKSASGGGEITWNFEKFLLGKDGSVIARFSPKDAPDDPRVIAGIETALS